MSNLLSKRSLLGVIDVPRGGGSPLVVDGDLCYEGEGLSTSYAFQTYPTHLESLRTACPTSHLIQEQHQTYRAHTKFHKRGPPLLLLPKNHAQPAFELHDVAYLDVCDSKFPTRARSSPFSEVVLPTETQSLYSLCSEIGV